VECIKSPGGHRRYSAASIESLIESNKGATVLSARVSTRNQVDDLQHQIDYLGQNYPSCQCVSDIGSGLNFKRKKFLALRERVAKGEIEIIVVAHKDRLCRFGFDESRMVL
jgi:putative resolvase